MDTPNAPRYTPRHAQIDAGPNDCYTGMVATVLASSTYCATVSLQVTPTRQEFLVYPTENLRFCERPTQ